MHTIPGGSFSDGLPVNAVTEGGLKRVIVTAHILWGFAPGPTAPHIVCYSDLFFIEREGPSQSARDTERHGQGFPWTTNLSIYLSPTTFPFVPFYTETRTHVYVMKSQPKLYFNLSIY